MRQSAPRGGGWRSRRTLLNSTLAAVAAILTVCAIEGASYVFGTIEGPLQPLRVGTIQIYGQHDSLLFWSLRPHAKAPDGTCWINGKGLRGPDVGPKEAGEFRILSLGESTTFGAEVPYEECYSAVLEQLLNAEARDGRVRVLNAGVPGYSLFQGVQFLKHRGLRLEPDLVLLYFGFNDFLPVAYLAKRAGDGDSRVGGLNDWELLELRLTFRGRLANFLTEHSNVYRGVLKLTKRARTRLGDARIETDPARPRVPREHRQRLLEMARDFCREHGIALVVVIPIYRSFDRHIKLLRSFTQTHDVAAVDLPATLPARFDASPDTYFLDSVHPSSRGHRLIAEAIHETVSPLVP